MRGGNLQTCTQDRWKRISPRTRTHNEVRTSKQAHGDKGFRSEVRSHHKGVPYFPVEAPTKSQVSFNPNPLLTDHKDRDEAYNLGENTNFSELHHTRGGEPQRVTPSRLGARSPKSNKSTKLLEMPPKLKREGEEEEWKFLNALSQSHLLTQGLGVRLNAQE